MANTQSCQPCCSTTTPVNTPGVAGADGADGAAGSDGTNAYTTTNATDAVYSSGGKFTVPAKDATVDVLLVNSTWMVIGQKIVISDAGTIAHFEYTTDLGSNGVRLTFLEYEGDAATGTVFAAGSGVSPAGVQPQAVTSSKIYDYKAVTTRGAAHEITAAYTQLTFNGTAQKLTLTETGTWLIKARVRVDYSFATYDFTTDGQEDQALKLKLFSPNLGVDINVTNGASGDTESTFMMPTTGAATDYRTLGWLILPPVFWATSTITDQIAVYAKAPALPDNTTDGKLMAFEASLVAVRVSDATSL